MKKERMSKLLALSAVSALLLCSCSSTSNNVIETNKGESQIMKEDEVHNYEYVSCDKIFDRYDEVFETEYTKFSLPDKSDVPITQPEGIYKLKISLVNAEQDVDWMADKVQKLNDSFNVLDEYEIEKKEDEQTYEQFGDIIFKFCDATAKDKHGNYILVSNYSSPSIYWKESAPIDFNCWDKLECTYIDKQSYKDTSAPYTDLIDTACDYYSVLPEIMEDDFVLQPNFIERCKYANRIQYSRVYFCKTYKGVTVRYFLSTYGDDKKDGLDIQNIFDFTNFVFNIRGKPASIHTNCSYTVSEEEQLDNILSLKGACDLLEDKLAPNAHFDFDRVELLYEARGTTMDNPQANATQDYYLSPTWYFIKHSDEPNSSFDGAEYISVDCVTGDVSVKIL